jgi:hypothetical protein
MSHALTSIKPKQNLSLSRLRAKQAFELPLLSLMVNFYLSRVRSPTTVSMIFRKKLKFINKISLLATIYFEEVLAERLIFMPSEWRLRDYLARD